MNTRAYLSGTQLPPQFSYKPYVPRKRKSIIPTANGVVTQYANPEIVHGDSTVAFTLTAAFANEWQTLYNFYRAGGDLVFEGYWGETLIVRFDRLDDPVVRGRLFNISGQFQVLVETTRQSVTCGPATGDSSLVHGLISFWKMEEATASVRQDELNVHPLALGTTNPTQVAGILGNAAQFDNIQNTDGLIRANASMGKLNILPGNNFSCSFWYKPSALGTNQSILGVWSESGDQRSWRVSKTSGNILAFEMSGSGTSGNTTILSNAATVTTNWHHLVVTYDQYLDLMTFRQSITNFSAIQNTVAQSVGGFASSADFIVGGRDGGGLEPLHGAIDSLGIWDKVLTESEQEDLFNGYNAIDYPF